MGTAGAGEHGVARANVADAAIDDIAALAADDVIDLVLVVLVQADAGTLVQHALAEEERQAGRVGEERIRGGGAGAAMRAGLLAGQVSFAYHLRGMRLGCAIGQRGIARTAVGIAHHGF